jgi:peptidyl-prolyl cis-trans isomerase D
LANVRAEIKAVLQNIRDKFSGWFAIVLVGAVAFVFIFWGNSVSDSAVTTHAAKVNGEPIPLQSVRNAWQQRQQELQRMFRGELPEDIVKAQQQQLLEQQIRAQLLVGRAQELGYRASDQALQNYIVSIPSLIEDGKFSKRAYERALREAGLTTTQFEIDLRKDMELKQLQGGILESAFVTPGELVRRNALQNEQREIEFVTVKAAAYMATVKVTDEEIQKFYDENKARFVTPESVDLEYIELRLADLEKQVAVTDEALKEYYEQVKERFAAPERRLARHILITADSTDATTDVTKGDEQAKKTADEVMAKLQSGGDFAALAKQYSKDPGSAEKGGELDWAGKGTFVGPFEDAVFAMNKNELRGPIKSQFGYHLIQLMDSEGGGVKSFDEVRAELEKEYRSDHSQKSFEDQSQKLADLSFNSLTELESVAQSLGLPLQKLPGFSRQSGGAFASEPKIAEAAFSENVLEKSENSALIKLAEDHVLVLRDAARHPSEPIPLATVRATIDSELRTQAARQAAAAHGAELLAQLNGGAAWSQVVGREKLVASGKKFVGRTDKEIPAEVVSAAFQVPRASIASDKASIGNVSLMSGDSVIYAVSNVRIPPIDTGSPELAAAQKEAKQSQGVSEFGGYLSHLLKAAKIERNPNAFE